MQNYRTETEIKEHILQLIEARKPTQDQAHEEFNKGVKFATDYVLEFINTKRMTVFIQKEQKELVAKIEQSLGLSSYPELGDMGCCPTGRPYKTFLNGDFKAEGESINIDKQLNGIVSGIISEFSEFNKDNDCIYWRIYPTYETTNVGTYLRMRLTIDKKRRLSH